MKINEIITESHREYKTQNVNVHANIDPGRGHLTQNINNIRYLNDNEPNIYQVARGLSEQGVDQETIEQMIEQFRIKHEQVNDQTNQLLLELTDAYYATAYAIVAQAAEGLLEEINKMASIGGNQ
jgi:hypothetical protein